MSYELIETIEATSDVTTIEFTNIPSDATDLVLRLTVNLTQQDGVYYLRFNDDTGNNYTSQSLYGIAGSSPSSQTRNYTESYIRLTSQKSGYEANVRPAQRVYIANYTSTTTHKPVQIEQGLIDDTLYNVFPNLEGATYNSNSAISSIQITGFYSNGIDRYSKAALYKITA